MTRLLHLCLCGVVLQLAAGNQESDASISAGAGHGADTGKTNSEEADVVVNQGCLRALQCFENLHEQEDVCTGLIPAPVIVVKQPEVPSSNFGEAAAAADECIRVQANVSEHGRYRKAAKEQRFRACLEEMVQKGEQPPVEPIISIKQRVKCAMVSSEELLPVVTQFDIAVTSPVAATNPKKCKKGKLCADAIKSPPLATVSPLDQCLVRLKLIKGQCKRMSKCACAFSTTCAMRAKAETIMAEQAALPLFEKYEACKQRRKLEEKAWKSLQQKKAKDSNKPVPEPKPPKQPKVSTIDPKAVPDQQPGGRATAQVSERNAKPKKKGTSKVAQNKGQVDAETPKGNTQQQERAKAKRKAKK